MIDIRRLFANSAP